MSSEVFARNEVQRAVGEVRAALSQMAQRQELAYPLMGICALIDRVEVDVTPGAGDEAFLLDEKNSRVSFRVEMIERVVRETDRFADEVNYADAEERLRLVQKAVNQFVVHELIHIKQNFPHFASVEHVKQGMPNLGVPILDAAADVVAAWTCANVECERLGTRSEIDVMLEYVNALIVAYLVGAFVFEVRGRPPKIQRALGLVISALLVQGLAAGTLKRDAIFDGWRELSPILVLDLEKTAIFNAFVFDGMPGLLVPKYETLRDDLAGRFWRSVGLRPLMETLQLGGEILMEIGALRAG